MKILKSILFYVVGLFVIAITVWGGMNLTGFCWSQGRYLSDQEIFRNFITTRFVYSSVLSVNTVKRRAGNVDVTEVVKYKSYEDFIEKNPNCCKYYRHYTEVPEVVNAGGGRLEPPFYYKLLGCYWSNMAFKYKVYYRDVNNELGYIFFTSSSWVNSCGDRVKVPWKYNIGSNYLNGDTNHG